MKHRSTTTSLNTPAFFFSQAQSLFYTTILPSLAIDVLYCFVVHTFLKVVNVMVFALHRSFIISLPEVYINLKNDIDISIVYVPHTTLPPTASRASLTAFTESSFLYTHKNCNSMQELDAIIQNATSINSQLCLPRCAGLSWGEPRGCHVLLL